jgi:DNA-binding response OmpR family regulator
MTLSDRARIQQLEAQVADLTEELEAWRGFDGDAERRAKNDEREARVRTRIMRLKPAHRPCMYGGVVVRLLLHFIDHPDRLHRRETLLDVVAGEGSESLPKVVDVRVSHARDVVAFAGFDRTMIETHWGRGYRITAANAELLKAALDGAR